MRRAEGRKAVWLEALALLAILAAAAGFRFWRLGSLPPGIDLDEARNGIEVLGVLAGKHPLFFTTFDPREPIFIYSLSLFVRAFGNTALAMHLAGAAWGLLGVALTYPVARQWFGRRVALLATAGMACSLWDVAMSRWAERDLTLPPFLLLFLFFLWRGFERRSKVSFALAGMFLSVCAYAYVAARILPVLVLLIIAAQWLLARRLVESNRAGLLAGLAAAMATIAPLAVYFVRNPDVFFGRIALIASTAPAMAGVAPDSVWQTALRTLGMFFVKGDANWRDGLPDQPVFVVWLAIPFAAGLLWTLRHALAPAKDVRLGETAPETAASTALYPCLWLLVWQAVLLIPAFLARPSPQFDRTIGAAPPTCILLGVGLAAVCAWLGERRKILGRAAWPGAAILVGLMGADTVQAYFGTWAQSDGPKHVFEYGQSIDAEVLNRLNPDPARTFIFLGYQSSTAVRYLAPRYDASVAMEDFSRLLPLPASGPATYVFASPSLPSDPGKPSVLESFAPAAVAVAQASFGNGEQAARVYQLDESQLRALRGAARPIQKAIGDSVQLETIDTAARSMPVKAGENIRLVLGWRMLKASPDNYAAFVHVVDAGGKLVAQAAPQGMASNGWLPGQEFLSLHEFRLPEGLPRALYTVLAGVDRRTVLQPSQSLGELGAQVAILTLELQS